jgi:hypothetical protein
VLAGWRRGSARGRGLLDVRAPVVREALLLVLNWAIVRRRKVGEYFERRNSCVGEALELSSRELKLSSFVNVTTSQLTRDEILEKGLKHSELLLLSLRAI